MSSVLCIVFLVISGQCVCWWACVDNSYPPLYAIKGFACWPHNVESVDARIKTVIACVSISPVPSHKWLNAADLLDARCYKSYSYIIDKHIYKSKYKLSYIDYLPSCWTLINIPPWHCSKYNIVNTITRILFLTITAPRLLGVDACVPHPRWTFSRCKPPVGTGRVRPGYSGAVLCQEWNESFEMWTV